MPKPSVALCRANPITNTVTRSFQRMGRGSPNRPRGGLARGYHDPRGR